LKSVLAKQGSSTAVGDEGGFAPMLPSNEAALEAIMTAIAAAGYEPGKTSPSPLDPAASEFYQDGIVRIQEERQVQPLGRGLSRALFQLAGQVSHRIHRRRSGGGRLVRLAGHDREIGDRVQLVGDDLFVTNVERLAKGDR